MRRPPFPPVLRVAALAWLLLAGACRSAHESVVLKRLTQSRLAQSLVPQTLADLEGVVLSLPPAVPGLTEELRLATATLAPDGERTWCLTLADLKGCYTARAEGQSTRLAALAGTTPSSALTHRLWQLVDPAGAAGVGSPITESELSQLANEEEAAFTPRWSFLVGARTGAISLVDAPSFTFGGQAGVRYWANYFLVPGLAVRVENVLQRERSFLLVSPQARLEFTMWLDENTRFLNLPNVTFLIGVEPLFAFAGRVEVGARAVVGVHLLHLGRFVTPFFFEFGYQSLTVNELGASGLYVSLGLGL